MISMSARGDFIMSRCTIGYGYRIENRDVAATGLLNKPLPPHLQERLDRAARDMGEQFRRQMKGPTRYTNSGLKDYNAPSAEHWRNIATT